MSESYRQFLPDLELSIERCTDAVPNDGRWYLLRRGEMLGRFGTLAEAKNAWAEFLHQAGWAPPRRPVDPVEIRQREQRERWARNRAG